jgi:hypothetical protein
MNITKTSRIRFQRHCILLSNQQQNYDFVAVISPLINTKIVLVSAY